MAFETRERAKVESERESEPRAKSAPPPARRMPPPAAGNQAVARMVARWRVQGAAPSRLIQRKDVTIVGKPTLRFPNLGKLRSSKAWKELIEPLIRESNEATVVFHLQQMFSAPDDIKFESTAHFLEALRYDIANKTTGGDQPHNLQEQYMTLYGWKARAKGSGPPSSAKKRGGQTTTSGKRPERPKKGGAEPESEQEKPPVLKIYRTMKEANWLRLQKKEYIALAGHLGDFKQAHNYLHRKSPEKKVLVEFILKPGAERELFSSSVMAFPDDPGPLKVPNIIQSTLKTEGARGSFAVASTNEGLAKGKVGVKAERGEAGFSFGIGGAASAELFMGLVDDMKVIGRSEVDKTAKPEQDDQDLAVTDEEEPKSQSTSPPAPDDEPKEPADDGERAARMKLFLEALAQVPQVDEPDEPRSEPADPSNQYVPSSNGSKETGSGSAPEAAAHYDPARLKRRANPGGGDCLFHALIGRTLNEKELLGLRKAVAAVRTGMPENQLMNAMHIASALDQSGRDADIMTGRHSVPNSVYALLQAVPGVYAGEDEIIQWCTLKPNRTVLVIDSTAPLANGALAVFTQAGRVVVPVTAATLYSAARARAVARTVVLYKTPNHWERVDRIG